MQPYIYSKKEQLSLKFLPFKREKEAKKSIPPSEMFLKETDKYSKFDEKVKKLN